MNIQWYPGHMTKAKKNITESLSLVDIVIELLDARIPYSSKNPDIDSMAANKHRIVVLNKSDLSDGNVNKQWKAYYEATGAHVVLADSVKGKGLQDITTLSKDLMAEKVARMKSRGRIFVPVRAMIVGIPNVGKSTLINKYVGRQMAKTGDRPGVTKTKQWIKVKKDFELLDTPGILWPKFEDEQVGLNLAFTGAVNDNILDMVTLGIRFIETIDAVYPNALKQRYDIDYDNKAQAHEILEKIGRARGFLLKGSEINLERTSIILLDEFRGGKLGNVSLERPTKEI